MEVVLELEEATEEGAVEEVVEVVDTSELQKSSIVVTYVTVGNSIDIV